MKVNIKEVSKIAEKVEDIDGWEVKSLKTWESKGGTEMVTVQLTRGGDPPNPAPEPPRPDPPKLVSKPPIQTIDDSLDKYKENMKQKKRETKLSIKVKDIDDEDDDVSFKIS